jgi:uncharacterized protein YegJ (DUF2314 family)
MHNVAPSDEAMARAHEQATSTLPGIKERFQAGLPLGERLYVKHGFPRTDAPGLSEFMWVVVHTWKGRRIRGALANDPSFRIDLRSGQDVELDDDGVFDWLLHRDDGANEGAFTVGVGDPDEHGDPSDATD